MEPQIFFWGFYRLNENIFVDNILGETVLKSQEAVEGFKPDCGTFRVVFEG